MNLLGYLVACIIAGSAFGAAGLFIHDRAVRKTRLACAQGVVLSAMEQAVAETVDLAGLVPAQRDGER